jgi:1,4-alpha-glucan branching enzyme
MSNGAFTFVLHSHMPFYGGAGRSPHGEENLHDVMAECYLPLLEGLAGLHEAGVRAGVTLGITPVLAEQLSNTQVIGRFEEYLDRQIAAAAGDVGRFERSDDLHFLYLAHFYLDRFRHLLQSFRDRFNRDLIGGFRRLQDGGRVEIVTSAATYPYLPLMQRDSTVYAQVKLGKRVTERHFGKSPAAVWLPECAYRSPHYVTGPDGKGYLRSGLESTLEDAGLRLFFSESGAVDGAFEAYRVRDSDVAVLGCNRLAGEQVLGAMGYPGVPAYRESHRRDAGHGFKYWRVTDKRLDIAYKQPYEPYHAGQRTQEHAEQFVRFVEKQLRDYAQVHRKPGIVAAGFDAELFGHRWFEGVDWLKKVLAMFAHSDQVELTTASAWLERNPPDTAIELPESSSGHEVTHAAWANSETGWMWEAVHAAERRMEGLVTIYPYAESSALEALNQAAREVMLLEASDWERLYTSGQARQYAAGRFYEHVARFQELAGALESRAPEGSLAGLARAYKERDNLFPEMDYRLFSSRQPD